MQIFLDTGSLKEVKEALQWCSLDGVTTNPTLIMKSSEGINNPEQLKSYLLEITELVPTTSLEVLGKTADEMIKQAREIQESSSRFNIKIPFCKEGLKALRQLRRENIRTNATLIFSPNQALLAAKAGANYISIFLGRLDDIGMDPLKILQDTLEILKQSSYNSKVIAASIRSPIQIIKAAKMGCHIVTIPPNILEQMLSHPLTEKGIKIFEDDYNKFQEKEKETL